MSKININQDHVLEVSKHTTFGDFNQFIEDNMQYFEWLTSFYIHDIGDSSTWDKGKKFSHQFDTKSKQTIYDFFLKNKLYDPNYQKADEDLRIFFHTKFVGSIN